MSSDDAETAKKTESGEGTAPEGKAPEGKAPEGKAPEGKTAEDKTSEGTTAEDKTAEAKTAEAKTEKVEIAKSVPATSGDAAPKAAEPDLSKPAKADEQKPGKKDAAASKPAARSGSLPLVAAFAAGVLAVAAITAVVAFFLQSKERGEKLDSIADSTSAACKFGKDVSVYDYSKNLDDYFATVKAGASGEFLKEFSDAATALKDSMVAAKVKTTVEDVQCGYLSGDTTSAKVLVTLTQYRTNFTQTNPEPQFMIITADLTKAGDKWLVEKLGSPLFKGAGSGLPGAPAPSTGQQPAPSGQPAPKPGS